MQNTRDSFYEETTNQVKISVKPTYLMDQSDPDNSHYVWAYHIRIENLGDGKVQLLNRHWKIADANGKTQEVRGPGVVGEQPVINPGDSFEYSSGTPLKTTSGFMMGSYEMETADGAHFDATIPAFSLDIPDQFVQIH